MRVEFVGRCDWQRFGETLARLLAEADGCEVVPGSVKVTLKSKEGR